MILRLYALLLYLLTPAFLFRLLWRSVRQPEYRNFWQERLGMRALDKADIWIHAVSVGEVHLAIHLIEHWWQDSTQYPRLIISCTTPTGRERISSWRKRSGHINVQICYIPIDIPGVIARVLRTAKPAMLLIMETEVWPGMISQAHKQGIKTALINARMSVSSARGYTKVKFLLNPIFSCLDLVLAQSKADAQRLQCLGVNSSKCYITDSMKFDFKASYDKIKYKSLQTQIGKRPVIFTIGSSRSGEEQALLAAIDALLKKHPKALICWAPRHKELSFPIIEEHLANKGDKVSLRSQNQFDENTSLLLIDSWGELALFYALADCVFIGGTLVDTGSQNLIEPALLAKPIISGPSHYNFAQAHKALMPSGGLLTVKDTQALIDCLLRLADDTSKCVKLGKLAQNAIQSRRGATNRTIEHLQKLYNK